MSARQPRWEIVQTAAGWHARFRFRSSNGNVIVSSEVYKKKANARNAITLATGWLAGQTVARGRGDRRIEVREVDAR